MTRPLPASLRKRRPLVVIAGLIAAVLIAVTAYLGIGRWLVVADDLLPARAIVVFGGEVPFRALEAAAIFHQGWASEVWLTRGFPMEEDLALAQLGIQSIAEYERNRQVLERLGVPAGSIRVLDERVENTAQEVSAIARALRGAGGKRVILVTSKYHTRRVRILWRQLTGNTQQAIVRYSHADPSNPNRWWRSSRDSLAVAREFFGILNALAGFPLHP